MNKEKKLRLYGSLLAIGLAVFILEIFVCHKPDGFFGLAICCASVLMILVGTVKLCILSDKFTDWFLAILDILFCIP